MATKTIPQLTLRSSITDACMYEIDDGIQSYRVTALQLVAYLATQPTWVVTAMLADSGITAAKIAADAVTTVKILDLNVTAAKLADLVISDLTAVTPVAADFLALADTSDSNKKKKAGVSYLRNAVYRSVTTTDAVGVDDETMKLSSASFTSTLPDASAAGVSGKRYKFIHAGTSLTQVYTLATTSAQTIGGVASGSYKLVTNGEILEIESDGANWIIVNHVTHNDWQTVSGGIAQFYTFTVAAGSYSGTAGALYTNNGNTYTLATTFTTAATSIVLCGTAAPSASGTLTNSSGTHVGNPIYSAVAGGSTLVGATTTVPAYNTSPTLNALKWRRRGSHAVINYNFAQTSAGTVAGSGDLLFGLPPNIVADLTKTITTYTSSVGTGMEAVAAAQAALIQSSGVIVNGSGASMGSVLAYLYSSTQFRMSNYSFTGSVAGGNVSSAYFPATNNPLAFNVTIELPIVDWQP